MGLVLVAFGAMTIAGLLQDGITRLRDAVPLLFYLAVVAVGGALIRKAVRRLRRRLRFTVTGQQVRVDWRVGNRCERTETFDQSDLDRVAVDLELGAPAGVSMEGNYASVRFRQEQRRRLVLQTRVAALPLTDERQDTSEAPYEDAARQIEEFLAIGKRRER